MVSTFKESEEDRPVLRERGILKPARRHVESRRCETRHRGVERENFDRGHPKTLSSIPWY